MTLPDPIPNGTDDRRTGTRHSSVLLIGRVLGGTQAACVVHDISRSGLMARFVEAPPVGAAICIELRGLPPVRGIVRWVDGRKAGIAFDTPQPFEQVFRGRDAGGLVARPPRFPLDTPARLRLGDEGVDVGVIDISAGGMKLTEAPGVKPGQTGQVMLPLTGTAMFGTVCWRIGGRMGFRFVVPLPLDALSVILAQSRDCAN